MLRPTHLVVLLLAACLAGCGSYAMVTPDSAFAPDKTASASGQQTTGSVSATSNKTDAAALNSLFTRAADGKLNSGPLDDQTAFAKKPIALADASETTAPITPPKPAEKIAAPHGRAYLFRGVAGLIYSRGIDKLADRIKRTGIPASVDTYLAWQGVAEQAVRDYRRDPAPIVLIGHSMGGDSALDFAEMLNEANIPVALLVTYDPTRIADNVPPNVERYINLYQSDNIMGGGNVVQGSRFHGHYASYNLKDHSEIVHINIEKADRIQEQLVTKVAQLAGTPADAEGETVPLHLEVPADASIDLWDSGLPVQAHAGDTLKTLAATYHVPVWALAQSNSVPEREPLTDGQRIVVPRRLVPMPAPTTVSSYAGSGQ